MVLKLLYDQEISINNLNFNFAWWRYLFLSFKEFLVCALQNYNQDKGPLGVH